MLFISLPSFASHLLAVLMALVASLTYVRSRPKVERPYDCEREIADLTLKVRHPWQYRAKSAWRKVTGE